jgi:iron complex outermembrane recepter protein
VRAAWRWVGANTNNGEGALFKLRVVVGAVLGLGVGAAVVPVLAQTPSQAQTPQASQPAASDSDELQSIIVTATKEATPLQTTPIAITAVTAEQLELKSIENTADLGSIVPNATFREAQGAYGKGVTAFIRGIGQGDTNLASEPGVAFYVDDVYYPLLFGSMFDLLDLDHVEVLRGPQGTLFGRNALAGAVNLVGKAPTLGKTTAFGEITTGQYNRLDERGGINLPLGETMAIRLTAASKRRTGSMQMLDFRCQMIKNGTPELAGNFPFSNGLLINTANYTPDNCVTGHLGGEDSHSGRGQLLWMPLPDLQIFVTGDWSEDNSENVADQLLAVNATTANANANLRSVANAYTAPGGPTFAYDSRFITGNPFTTYATYGDPTAAGTVVPGSSFYNGSVLRGGLRYPANSPTTNWGASTKIIYDFTQALELTTIVGYRKVDTVFSFDVDGSPLALENTRNNTEQSDMTGEVRLSGKSASWIDWVGGLFYYRGHGFVHATLVSPYLGLQRYQNNVYQPKSEAGYFNVNIRPVERLTLNLGGRYSHDVKPVSYSNLQDATPSGNIIFNVTPKDSRFDWKAGVNYELNDLTMLYTSAATGFRLPTFNSRPLQPDQVTQIPGDETVAYELGIKTDLLQRKLRVNATAFYTNYKSRPLSVSGQEYAIGANGQPVPGQQVTVPLPSGGTGATTCRTLSPAEQAAGTPGFQCIGRTYYVNTPGKIKGFEAEIEARPFSHFSVDGSMGYSHFASPDLDAATRVNHTLPGISEWTASGGVQYEVNVPALGGGLTPRLDWFYQGAIVYSAVSTLYNQAAYSTFNGRLSYHNDEHDYTVSAGATNLFNKFYYRNFFLYQELGYPNIDAQPAPPREWFVSVKKSF